jgi:hypothetical protein
MTTENIEGLKLVKEEVTKSKVSAYDRLLMLVRGDVSLKVAGFDSIEHAAICIINTAEKDMASLRKMYEKENP